MTMSIFHRILFAGDFSERSLAAFGAAHSLAGESRAHLHVLNVVESLADHKEIEDELRAFYRAAPAVAVDYLVRRGDASDAILSTADEVKADLIVVGTHGRRGLDRLLCGSVAESVLQRSSRPVLVVRQTEITNVPVSSGRAGWRARRWRGRRRSTAVLAARWLRHLHHAIAAPDPRRRRRGRAQASDTGGRAVRV
jgi:nucleotide-binding universal stress UspA family protein